MKNKNWIEEDSKKIQIRDEMYLKNLKNLKGDRSIITKNTFRESSDKYPKFIKTKSNKIDFLKIKSNSQPSTNQIDTNCQNQNLSSRNIKNILEELLNSKKLDPKISKLSPITKKIQELKNKFLMKTDEKFDQKDFKIKENATFSILHFFKINPLLSKEKSTKKTFDTNLYMSTQNNGYKSTLSKTTNQKEITVKTISDCIEDPHKQKIEDKKLFLLKMLSSV